MSKVQDLLSKRLRKPEQSSKMAALAEQSASGTRTGFSGIFSVSELNPHEKQEIAQILDKYSTGDQDLNADLSSLVSLTSEVQAINNQAAILHGERIKKAQTILKKYADGAFTAWLVSTYGNRQTPYNLLQYYEFYIAMPSQLRPQIESMPRQAIYTLASREGTLEEKRAFVEEYRGETKNELIIRIREQFPLDESDGRRQDVGENVIAGLRKLLTVCGRKKLKLSEHQKATISRLVEELEERVESSKVKR